VTPDELTKYNDYLKWLRIDLRTVDKRDPWYRAWLRVHIEATTDPAFLPHKTDVHRWNRNMDAWIDTAIREIWQREFNGNIPGIAAELGVTIPKLIDALPAKMLPTTPRGEVKRILRERLGLA
jgi:hypothetical protein